MKRHRVVCRTIAAAAAFLLPLSAFSQGSLTPPGPPAPTMKKLDELEPRTNLQATPVPAGVDTSNPDYHFIINQPGSYYLSANIAVTKSNGVKINAEGVTLDLNGFQISGPSVAGSGIEISPTSYRATVRNGTIKGFLFGVLGLASASALRDLAVSECTSYGIIVGGGAILESCRAHNNSGNAGIETGAGSTLTNCTAIGNTAGYGISTASGCVLTNCAALSNTVIYGISVFAGCSLINCSASFNTGTGASSAGINAGFGSTLTHCSAYFNGSSATPSSFTGMGFSLTSGCTIHNCTAQSNTGDGIKAGSDCLVRENDSLLNAAGIHSTGSNNRIEGNNVVSNASGIKVEGVGNLIIKNSASDNSIDYAIAASNRYGPIVDISAAGAPAVNGKSAADTTMTTHPWANFSY